MTAARNRTRLLVLAAAVFVVALSAVGSGSRWHDGLVGDPDGYMRLAVLDDALGGGRGLISHVFLRDGAPQGMQIHWTLPFDLLMTALAAPWAAFVGWHDALTASLPLVAVANILLLAGSVAVLCAAIGCRGAAPWAVMLLAASPSLMGYAVVGKISHHVFAVTLGVMALASAIRLARTMHPASGVAAAVWSVLAVWESLEGDIAACLAGAVIVLAASLRRRSDGVLAFAVTAPLTALAAVLIDPPPEGWLALAADRLSLLQVALFAAIGVAAVLASLAGRGGRRPWRQALRGGAAAVVPLLAWAVFAGLTARPVLSANPDYLAYFWNTVSEIKPAWTSGVFFAFAAIPVLPALLLAGVLTWRRRHRPQLIVWLGLLGVLAFEAAAAGASVRLATHASALAAVVLGASLHAWLGRVTGDRAGDKTSAILVSFAFVGIFGAAAAAWQRRAEPPDRSAYCELGPDSAASVAAALSPGAIVAADLWIAPELLWRTGLRTIAGPYHRNWSGIADLAQVFRGTDDAAIRGILARRGAVAVLTCFTAESGARAMRAPESLAGRLASGQPPAWLSDVRPLPGYPDVHLYRVGPIGD